jgi:septal ring factor EnvC (AmiA/AmiB activator)
MMDSDMQRAGVRFNAEFNLGHILQAIVLGCGLAAYLVTTNTKGEQAARDLVALQQEVKSQITDLRGAVQQSSADVRQQIASLPDQRAKLEGAESRLKELAARIDTDSQRVSAIERSLIETRSDVNQVLRALQMPLPGAQRR